MRSVEESLRRLDTDFIDLLWVHAWDGMTPVDEVLRGLDDLVRSGKVHYIGISDTPAWVVSQANTMAELRGWTAFVGLQIEYSLLQRAPERELLPMAKQFGLAITPWGAIGGGALTGKYLKGDTGRVVESSARRSARANGIATEVVKHAEILGVTPAQLVINWTRQRDPNLTSIPIIGARTAAQLQDSLGCLNFQIPTETIQALDAASPIELGFPHEFLATENIRELIFGGQYAKIIR
jgi:aryl-alcohol dehydrogenase-like predicted oxidoreductase